MGNAGRHTRTGGMSGRGAEMTSSLREHSNHADGDCGARTARGGREELGRAIARKMALWRGLWRYLARASRAQTDADPIEIGRASGRERGEISVGGGSLKKKKIKIAAPAISTRHGDRSHCGHFTD